MHISGAHARVLLQLYFPPSIFLCPFVSLRAVVAVFDWVSCCSSRALSLMCRYFDERWLSERKSSRRRGRWKRRRGGIFQWERSASPQIRSPSLSRGSQSLRTLARLPSLDAGSLASTLVPYKGSGFRVRALFPTHFRKVKAACESVDSPALFYSVRHGKACSKWSKVAEGLTGIGEWGGSARCSLSHCCGC